ncbi:nucleoside kinase [Devosia sediminis]|uniref:Nucleoside kinase n=1 Tax=Devosia sediminis TaxID=2798801 RepID=A0A934MMX9_9HYPH|nr:nucleoside kinase [Devosia sediminis]MBJ3786675.1 nucleoside kinase [Devosia sediminis]
MGIRNYLVIGSSGTGKTAVATELERRGHHVVHGDRVLAYRGDPETGEALAGPPPDVDPVAWGYAHWIWRVDAVREAAADTTHAATFFCGDTRNFHRLLDVFDKVFVLDLDVETLNRRIEGRPGEPGFVPEERAVVLRHHRRPGYHPPGIVIDTTGPVSDVVDAILAQIDR